MSGAAPQSRRDAAGDPRFDPYAPNPARVYNFWLGGKDHFRADRRAAQQVIRARPQVVEGARANRAFHARVVRYLAAQAGVRQFLDIGAGLPAAENTHEKVTRVPVAPRTHAQINALFGGLSLVAPGVVKVTEWRADSTGPVGQAADLYAGLVRVRRTRR